MTKVKDRAWKPVSTPVSRSATTCPHSGRNIGTGVRSIDPASYRVKLALAGQYIWGDVIKSPAPCGDSWTGTAIYYPGDDPRYVSAFIANTRAEIIPLLRAAGLSEADASAAVEVDLDRCDPRYSPFRDQRHDLDKVEAANGHLTGFGQPQEPDSRDD